MKHIGYGGVGSGEEGGAEDGGDREIPGLREARDSPGDPYVSRAATSGGVREQVGGQARTGVTGVRRLRGQQEARLLKFRRDRGELRHGGTDDVADRVVTENSVASPGTADGVITPPVQNLTAKTASRVMVPDRHAKTAPQGSAEEGRGDVSDRGSRGGREPSTRTRSTDGGKVATTSPSEGWVMQEGGYRASLELGRERSLRGGIGLSINTGTSRDCSPESRLSGTEAAALIKIERIKRRPDDAAEITASSKAGDVSSGSMLTSRPSTDPPEAIPKEASRQSSSEREAPTRRPRARRMSESASRRPTG